MIKLTYEEFVNEVKNDLLLRTYLAEILSTMNEYHKRNDLLNTSSIDSVEIKLIVDNRGTLNKLIYKIGKNELSTEFESVYFYNHFKILKRKNIIDELL